MVASGTQPVWPFGSRDAWAGLSIGFAVTFVVMAYGAWQVADVIAARQSAPDASRGKSLRELKLLEPDEFERWTVALFRRIGFGATHVGRSGDHGVDLIVTKDGERAVVQCKRHQDWRLPERDVRDLYGVMHAEAAQRAYIVTTGRVSKPARKWAEGKPITIWDGTQLERLSRDLGDLAEAETGHSLSPSAVKDGVAQEPVGEARRVCAQCGTPVSPGVAKYCLDQPNRFGGRVYCMDHQSSR